ncbi:hypothetical protein M3O96_11980 [Aquiflexum sp. TKW24L]|uniref:hypothetical protein n=1 Tax=Aquiflexum sp. TKW24L TaxID=2942212 RepID=UPI0020BEA649|nr:hypothetical protein [Aquiflexum sp. TKW24L]MCL6259812.1 hypothetical protein [Aquiflexum sp. TKW24L]
MKRLKSITALIMVSGMLAFGCEDYPDGPAVSLIPKAERVGNEWKVGEALDNGTNVTANYSRYELDLTPGGAATLTAQYSLLGMEYDFVTDGTWEFVSDEQKISFDFANDLADGVYEILKLETNDMWLKEDGGTLELHFIPR